MNRRVAERVVVVVVVGGDVSVWIESGIVVEDVEGARQQVTGASP